MSRIRTLIVDDEPLARGKLVALLAGEPEIEIIGERADGRQTISAIDGLKPELVFLDKQMPELGAFGVLAAIGKERRTSRPNRLRARWSR